MAFITVVEHGPSPFLTTLLFDLSRVYNQLIRGLSKVSSRDHLQGLGEGAETPGKIKGAQCTNGYVNVFRSTF